MKRLRILAVLALLTGCKDSGGPPDDTDNIVEGVNLTRLFAPPTPAEIQIVSGQWAARTPALQCTDINPQHRFFGCGESPTTVLPIPEVVCCLSVP